MKKSKKIIALAVGVAVVLTVVVVAIVSKGKKENPEADIDTTYTSENTSVEETVFIDESEFTQEATSGNDEELTSESTGEYFENNTAAKKSSSASYSTKQTTASKQTTAKATTTKQATTKQATTKPAPTQPVTNPTKYSCGMKNHSCSTIQEHEFLCELESKGCPVCGSHSCVSFYAKDEWGNWCYDITKCPDYSKQKDPTEYCEHCGKKIGLGDDGTCVRFTVDTECPICGKLVKAKTCHTH